MSAAKRSKGAVVYCRISNDRSGEQLGVRRQERLCRKLAEEHGIPVVAVYVDDDVSAYKGRKRPGYVKTCEAIERGDVGTLIAWASDRITRSPAELEALIDRLDRSHCRVLTVTEGAYDLRTSSSRLTARIVGAVARAESERRGERLAAKHEELARAGKSHGGGVRPFGFEADRVTINKTEADALRFAARRILDGASLNGVCAEMTVPTVSGRPWSRKALRGALIAPRTAGRRQHQGEDIGDAQWSAILDRETWQQVKAVLSDPRRKTTRPSSPYLLSGGIVRTTDGRRLSGHPDMGRRCYVAPPIKGVAPGTKIDTVMLDALVVDTLLAVSDKTNFRPAERPKVDERDLRAVEAELDELAALRGRGDISLREWLSARGPLLERLEKAKGALNMPTRAPGRVDLLAKGGLRAAWPTLSIAEQRDVVATVIESVVIASAVRGRNRFDADRVTIRWRH